MKIIYISEATRPQIDYLVAKEEGHKDYRFDGSHGRIGTGQHFNPTSDWSHGGPIIEREKIAVVPKYLSGTSESGGDVQAFSEWTAYPSNKPYWLSIKTSVGPTSLIAAMRCFLVSRLGETAEVPEEL